MRIKKHVVLMILFGIGNLYGFEVNTHQALTRCAITTECNKNGGTLNLDTFAINTELNISDDYNEQIFEKYKDKDTNENMTYKDYIKDAEEAISNFEVNTTGNYKGMIEAGVILEDAVHHNAVFGGDGRFNNHFYAAQLNSKVNCNKETLSVAGVAALMGRSVNIAKAGVLVTLGNSALMKTNKALCIGFGARTDNIDWALNKNVDLSLDIEFNNKEYLLTKRTNDYGLDDAFSYFRKSFIGSVADRKKYQAKLFASLGFMVHLVQDIHSPAHCRDNSHPSGDYLEMYGRVKGGFFLRNGSFSHGLNNPHITQAIAKMDMKKEMLTNNRFSTYEDFFKKEAEWVSKNFFSESHIPTWTVLGTESSFGGGTTINNTADVDSIFDDNPLPSEDTTYKEENEILSTGNTVPSIHGDLVNHTILNEGPIGLIDKGIFFEDEHMILPIYRLDHTNKLVSYGVNTSALEFTSENVMPRAVASTQAFINFFFRGQMETSLSDDHTKLVIKNVSAKDRVYSDYLLIFKEGGKFTLYAEKSGINKKIGTYTLPKDLHRGATRSIDIGNVIDQNSISDGTKITVVYDGNIGDNLGGYDDYGIGMKGLSADVFEVPKKLECKDKKLEAQIKQVQKWLKEDNRKHCVMFSPLNYSIKSKSVWTSVHESKCYSNIMYKNTAMGEYMNNFHRLDNTDLIDYFNKNVYHIDFEEEIQDTYTAGTGYSPRKLPRGDFDVSFTVTQNKNGKYYHIYNLPKLLTFTYLPSNAHIKAPHYHITCNSSKSLCNYLKRQGIGQNFNESQVDNLAPYDFLASPHLKIYAVGDVIEALNKYYGEYYGKSFKDDKYPKDWLKKIVDWIESYDCKKISKTNIFYDEKRIEKSNQFKGL